MRLGRLCVGLATCVTLFVVLGSPSLVAVEPQKQKESAEERRLRNDIKERDQEIQKLKKEVGDERSQVKKYKDEVEAWKKKPVVPNDNVALVGYDTSGLFAKDPPSGTGALILECRKGTTLLLVWKHAEKSGGKSQKWEYMTTRLVPDANSRDIRLNLHKGEWSVYRSNPKAGYVHIGDVKVTDKATTLAIPDSD